MAPRLGAAVLAVLVLSASAAASRRAILSEAGGAQFELGDVQGMHRHLMGSLKTAQENAGIFVDDAHLFERPLSSNGRRLQQTDAAATALTNPDVLATLLALVSQGLNVGSFPGAALSLPGGSAFGYAPTDDSYCLFATQPYQGPPAATTNLSGPPPEAFVCVAAGAGAPTGPDTFPIDVNGNAFVCSGTAPPPTGRKLMQAPSPTDAAIGNALAAIGLPIWNCVVATTPAGNTTLGQAALAVLNDLGVVAEHLLVYLNANGQLTYEEDIINDFVSLTNPLYPTGPRLNFSIDFQALDKDKALFEEIFGKPAPVSPPSIAPPTPTTPGSPPSTPSGGGGSGDSGGGSGDSGSGSSSGGGDSSGGSSSTGDSGSTGTSTTTSSETTTPPAATGTATPSEAPPAPATATTLSAFDGYVDNCQVVIGSIPHADGNFDRNNNFSTVIKNGSVEMPLDTTNSFAGLVAYVIPASKATEYPALTAETQSTAEFCNDIASLEPVYNPLATLISANATEISANPLTTVAAFGQSYGLTVDALLTALAVSVPEGTSLWGYDALGEAATGSAAGLALLKTSIQVDNLVTAGANMLTNDTTLYATFAIVMNQAIAKKVLYSPPETTGRKLLQAPAVDLTNSTTLASILTIAAQLVPTQGDATTTAALIQGLTQEQLDAVAAAVANLNAAVAASTDADAAEKASYYASSELASQVNELATGTISTSDFSALTSASSISDALAKTTLPGSVTPEPAAAAPPPEVVPQTQSSTSTQSSTTSSGGGSGLSHSGKVALATVLPIVGVIAIVAVAAFLITRRNRTTYEEAPNSNVWWRRPFARSGSPAGPSTV